MITSQQHTCMDKYRKPTSNVYPSLRFSQRVKIFSQTRPN